MLTGSHFSQEKLFVLASKNSTPKTNGTRFADVETHRSYKLRFATAQLRDAEQAEKILLVGN